MSDIFEPPSPSAARRKASASKVRSSARASKPADKFDNLFGAPAKKTTPLKSKHRSARQSKHHPPKPKDVAEEDCPSSAVDLLNKEKAMRKVQRQDRVVEEVKMCLKPAYIDKRINKDDYKEIMKKCVHKVCSNKHGEINPTKIRRLVDGYLKKMTHHRAHRRAKGAPGHMAFGSSNPPNPYAFGGSGTSANTGDAAFSASGSNVINSSNLNSINDIIKSAGGGLFDAPPPTSPPSPLAEETDLGLE